MICGSSLPTGHSKEKAVRPLQATKAEADWAKSGAAGRGWRE